MNKMPLIFGSLFVVATAGFVALQQRPAEHASAPITTHAPGTVAMTGSATTPTGTASTPAPLSPALAEALANTSLAQTDVPATLSLDPNGNLIIDSASKAIMDYFLSLYGEMDDLQIRALIAQWATDSAGAEAAQQLLALYDQYVDYRLALADGQFAANGESDIRNQLAQRQQLRESIFGADNAAGLFADEDRYDQFSLERQAIYAQALSEEEQQYALDELYASLPEHLGQQYRQQQDLQSLGDAEQQIREQGGNEGDVFAYHQERFGDEAALRLQALNEQRAQWQQRYDDYGAQRDTILNASLSEEDQAVQLQQLRESLFDGPEVQRVEALDRMQQDTRSDEP